MHRIRRGAWLLALGLSCAQAATVQRMSPQGEVAQVRQVVVAFSEPVVRFGAPRLPDPFDVQCRGARTEGSGRWVDDRHWVHDFAEPLLPGTRCTVAARAGWAPLRGALEGRTSFAFSTGGPALVRTDPWEGAQVDEDQHFLLELTGPAVPASVEAHAWCEVEGIGERLPLRVVAGAAREAVLASRRIEGARAAKTLLVACARPLPPATPMRLVWGRGIASSADAQVLTTSEQHADFRVREPFLAEFACRRERADAPCLPIRPLVLRFSAPVARTLAEAVRLRPAQGEALAPVFGDDVRDPQVSELRFPTPLPANARFTLELPPGLTDDAGRALANAGSFPLAVSTGDFPPIAKFAAAPFGIVEWGAEAMLPVTLRRVQDDLRPGAPGGEVRIKRVEGDAQMLAWHARLARHHERRISAKEAGRPPAEWFETERQVDARGRTVTRRVERFLATRELSLLAGEAGAKRLDLPQLQGGDPRPFEVVGIPLAEPGYHVVEIESRALGAALLDKAAPMFVRTGVLVTNLGVHFKNSRENSVVWVTSLDRGRPVEGAEVAINDCNGRRLWAGRTDAQGLARVAQGFEPHGPECIQYDGLFVTARKPIADGPARGRVDTAFVFSDWREGIEGWRFNLPTGFHSMAPELRAHTVFDRTLLRAGETVSMKHFVREETSAGLAWPKPGELPVRARIVHEGSGQDYTVPLQWQGTRSATSAWRIPPAARLGNYAVTLERDLPEGDGRGRTAGLAAGSLRVEEFRVPLVDAQVSGPKDVQIAPRELPLQVQLTHLSGGGVVRAPLRTSALLRARSVAFDDHPGFSFDPPQPLQGGDEAEEAAADRLVADKLAATTDGAGAAHVTLSGLPAVTRAGELLAEVSFDDPNGEVQTVSTRIALWPAAVVPGIRAASWVGSRGRVAFTALALDTAGRPLAGQRLEVRGRQVVATSTRKRMVGGLYAYDDHREAKALGTLCSGRSDAHGLLRCEAPLAAAGEVELIVQAADAAGRVAEAATTVWITRQGELWFAQDNDDRIDVLPEKPRYEPGETARLQVRMPYREATALVAVEREGVIDTRVLTLRGDDPTIELKIGEDWGPNVYVSVLALRGRIRHVPWQSLFTWGWKTPLDWARAFWFEGREYQPPSAMVDLSRPSLKFGVAALRVGLAGHELQVAVTPDQPQYQVRQTVRARIRVTHQGRPPAAGESAEVAFAAVDEGLLALAGNPSWDLLAAMLRQRAWGVETSTAHGEIIGRRHYGRKAVPAGGGGGRGHVRELFDTLLVWKARVPLDAGGEAVVEVPLNDSLTSFRLVAIADAGVQKFGMGAATIRVTQDLQVLSGLPPLVREGDRFTAQLTLRNTTAREMKVRATLRGTAEGGDAPSPIVLPPQEAALAAGESRELRWPVEVPAAAGRIVWEAAAEDAAGGAHDRLQVAQQVSAAVPLGVQQATLVRLDGAFSLPVAAPAEALSAGGIARGGVRVALQPRLGAALPGIRRYFETYPFTCLEQTAARALALRDEALWAAVTGTLPSHLDADGLANYFPPRADAAPNGSDRLTAHLLAASHEAGLALPDGVRDRMLDGLAAFVEGRIERRFWSPRPDLAVRKLAAIEALARHGRAQPRMLGSIALTPDRWPTAAVIDWLRILRRLDGVPGRAARIEQAQQILRGRLAFAGTTLRFSTEDDDFWWWLMDSADANAARLVLAVIDDPAWRDELPRLVAGALARQRGGAWLTTTANLWGALALDRFSAAFESQPVDGRSTARLGDAAAVIDWSQAGTRAAGGAAMLAWPARAGTDAGTLSVAHEGRGTPWLTVQSLAAVPLKAPLFAGYRIARSVTPVERRDPSRWSRGDIVRVRLEVNALADMTWVVVSDPVPGGATVLGSGLGRDSALAARGAQGEGAWPAFEERGFEAFRSYFEVLPRGVHVIEYTLRLNSAGRFALPPTRVEAMYAPESFGALPNEAVEVGP